MLRPLTVGAKEILTFSTMTLSEEEKNLFKKKENNKMVLLNFFWILWFALKSVLFFVWYKSGVHQAL